MKLQLLLAIICFTLYVTCTYGSSLSADQKKNLVDALNKDRQEIGKRIGVQMKTLVYDPELENKINTTSPQICSKKFKLLLKWDSVGQEYWDALSRANKKEGRPKIEQSRRFFFPNYTSVACSNTYHCSKELDKYYTRVPEMIGKTVQFYGICVMGGEQGASEKLWKLEGLPPISNEIQKRNLVDALNKDRQEIGKTIGVQMKTLSYDPELEKKINTTSPQICSKKFKLLMKWDSVGQEYWDALSRANKKEGRPKIEQSRRFFSPNYTSVACSNTYHCSRELDKYYSRVPEMIGKTVQFYGICVMRGEASGQGESEKIWKVEGLPPISKYADIIGVQGLDEGTVSGKDSGSTGGSEDGKGSENGKRPKNVKLFTLILTFLFIFNL